MKDQLRGFVNKKGNKVWANAFERLVIKKKFATDFKKVR
jgi:hypothetical protein